MAKLESILVFHFGALGDFIISWPALGMLRAASGTKKLGLFGNPSWARLILAPDCVMDRESGKFAPLFLSEPHSGTDEFLKYFDQAVIFSQKPQPDLEKHLNAAMPRKCFRIPTRPDLSQPQCASVLQVNALKKLGFNFPSFTLPCCLPENLPKPRPVLAPGSGGKNKRLSCEEISRTISELEKAWPECLLILGPAEDPAYVAEIHQILARTRVTIKQSPSMPELAGYLFRACFYLGADSGVSHLAGALGAPTAVVFKASDPRIWTPHGPLVHALAHQEFQGLLDAGRIVSLARTLAGKRKNFVQSDILA
jgi:ADP-heptose:LPS heptosyltransferase